jgi:hypothetical protein
MYFSTKNSSSLRRFFRFIFLLLPAMVLLSLLMRFSSCFPAVDGRIMCIIFLGAGNIQAKKCKLKKSRIIYYIVVLVVIASPRDKDTASSKGEEEQQVHTWVPFNSHHSSMWNASHLSVGLKVAFHSLVGQENALHNHILRLEELLQVVVLSPQQGLQTTELITNNNLQRVSRQAQTDAEVKKKAAEDAKATAAADEIAAAAANINLGAAHDAVVEAKTTLEKALPAQLLAARAEFEKKSAALETARKELEAANTKASESKAAADTAAEQAMAASNGCAACKEMAKTISMVISILIALTIIIIIKANYNYNVLH